MLGRFLEIGIAVGDIAASVAFYERLGLRQLSTTDAWTHPYGVLSDGRLHLGLHQQPMPSPALTFVQPQLAKHLEQLLAAGIEPSLTRLGDETFNELRLYDPAGQAITLLEARTYSPASAAHPGKTRSAESLCGYFSQYSLPATDFGAARKFWEWAGFIALEEADQPYAHQPLTSDLLDLAFHTPRSIDAPLLVFDAADLPQRLEALKRQGIEPLPHLPRGVGRQRGALFEAPEGTLLLLLDQ